MKPASKGAQEHPHDELKAFTRKLPSVLLTLTTLLYPFLAVLGMRAFGPAIVIAVLCALILLRLLFGGPRTFPILNVALLVVGIAMIGASWFDKEMAIRLYPVFMNAAMLAAFGTTLIRPPSMVEKFARLAQPDLPERAVVYTRKVTMVWCVFFIGNGAIALWTALYAEWEIWAAYNGVIAYILMGLLAAGEWMVRAHLKRQSGEI